MFGFHVRRCARSPRAAGRRSRPVSAHGAQSRNSRRSPRPAPPFGSVRAMTSRRTARGTGHPAFWAQLLVHSAGCIIHQIALGKQLRSLPATTASARAFEVGHPHQTREYSLALRRSSSHCTRRSSITPCCASRIRATGKICSGRGRTVARARLARQFRRGCCAPAGCRGRRGAAENGYRQGSAMTWN